MKIIGHAYVAEKVAGKKDPNLYIGSLLPDITPYTVSTDVLETAIWDTRQSEKLYRYLQKRSPHDVALAIGVLAHGRLYGADRYDDIEYRGGPGYAFQKNSPLIDEVEECSHLSHKIAVIRSHNFVELGIDYLLLQKYSGLPKRVSQALTHADLEKIAFWLADCFQRDQDKILKGLCQLFSYFQPEDLSSADGLARIWARQAAGLPEHDRVDVEKAAKIIKKAVSLIKNDWEEFLEFTIAQVRKNLKPFLASTE